MQLATSKNISPQLYPKLLENNYFDDFSRGQSLKTTASFQPVNYFRGELSTGNFSFPSQMFSLVKKDESILLRNRPVNSFPVIELVIEKENSKIKVKDFKVERSDNSVQGELIYTRFFLMVSETKKCSLDIKSLFLSPFNLSFAELTTEIRNYMLFRARLARKLKFLELFFNTKFYLPEKFDADDIRQTEILFRGITEGEFSLPFDSSITIYNYKFDEMNLSDRKEFTFDYDDNLPFLGKLFPTGKITLNIAKAGLANPKILKNSKNGELIESLRLNIFDYQVDYCFEKYSDPKKLSKNKQKLNQFRNNLLKEEPKFLVDELDEYLSSNITDKVAIEIVEGLFQFHDFPDRFSVLKPSLEENQWRVPIALIYPKHEPIWLEDAFVDVKTGKVKMKISFDELLKKGKMKSKEVFSFE